MYIQSTRRKGPFILATFMLLILAFSLWNIGPRFNASIALPHPPGQPTGPSVRLDQFASMRQTYYAYSADPVTLETPTPEAARAQSDLYIQQSSAGRGYIIYLADGSSFRVAPGLLRSQVSTSDQGTFSNQILNRGAFTDSQGRTLTQVYPNHGAVVRSIVRSDSILWSTHLVALFVIVVLLVLGMILLARYDRFPWFTHIKYQPLAVMGVAVFLIVLALTIAGLRLI